MQNTKKFIFCSVVLFSTFAASAHELTEHVNCLNALGIAQGRVIEPTYAVPTNENGRGFYVVNKDGIYYVNSESEVGPYRQSNSCQTHFYLRRVEIGSEAKRFCVGLGQLVTNRTKKQNPVALPPDANKNVADSLKACVEGDHRGAEPMVETLEHARLTQTQCGTLAQDSSNDRPLKAVKTDKVPDLRPQIRKAFADLRDAYASLLPGKKDEGKSLPDQRKYDEAFSACSKTGDPRITALAKAYADHWKSWTFQSNSGRTAFSPQIGKAEAALMDDRKAAKTGESHDSVR